MCFIVQLEMCFMSSATKTGFPLLVFCGAIVSVLLVISSLTLAYAFILLESSLTHDVAILSLFFFAVCFMFQVLSLAYSIRSAINDDFDVVTNCFMTVSFNFIAAACFISTYLVLFFGTSIVGFMLSQRIGDSKSFDGCYNNERLSCSCISLIVAFFMSLLALTLRIIGMKPLNQCHERVATNEEEAEDIGDLPYLQKPVTPTIKIESDENHVLL